MAERLDPGEVTDFKELLISNIIQQDTVTQLLIEKGIITEPESFTKLKLVHAEYQNRER